MGFDPDPVCVNGVGCSFLSAIRRLQIRKRGPTRHLIDGKRRYTIVLARSNPLTNDPLRLRDNSSSDSRRRRVHDPVSQPSIVSRRSPVIGVKDLAIRCYGVHAFPSGSLA